MLDATPATAPVAPSTVPPNRAPATTAVAPSTVPPNRAPSTTAPDDEAWRDPNDVRSSPTQLDSGGADGAQPNDGGRTSDRRTDTSDRNGKVERPAARQPATSPLAELVGPSWSAIPPEARPRSMPAGIQIGSIDVSRFPIRPVGLQLDGQLEVPDETEIGWYRHGATAGEAGATVLAAHVSWNGTTGPFARLGAVEPGDGIELRLDDGSLRNYEVVERAIYGKLELPTDRIWRRSGDETLVLITCGGAFNPSIRRYEQNIVVYAVPVG